MNRRDFLAGSAGALGALSSPLALSRPCPVPELQVDGGTSVTTGCKSSVLADAAAALSVGESSTDLGATGLENVGANWIQQQAHWAVDAVRGSGIAVVRTQNEPLTKIFIYNEATNSFSHTTFQFPRTKRGHSWSMPTYDHATGTLYYLENGGQVGRIARHLHGDNGSTWSFFGDYGSNYAAFGIDSELLYQAPEPKVFVSAETCCIFMPNLFGTGDSGLVIGCQWGLTAYRFSTGLYQTLYNKTQWSAFTGGNVMQGNSGTYCRGGDFAVFSQGNSGTGLLRISNGPVVTHMPNTPLRVVHDLSGSFPPIIKVCDDPNQGNTFYGFEFNGTGRYWKWNPATNTLVLQPNVHPFTGSGSSVSHDNVILAPVYGKGVVWALEENSEGVRSRLFRPHT